MRSKTCVVDVTFKDLRSILINLAGSFETLSLEDIVEMLEDNPTDTIKAYKWDDSVITVDIN